MLLLLHSSIRAIVHEHPTDDRQGDGGFSPSSRRPKSAWNLPGDRVKKVVEEIANLDLNRNSILLLTVGRNELFHKNGLRFFGGTCAEELWKAD